MRCASADSLMLADSDRSAGSPSPALPHCAGLECLQQDGLAHATETCEDHILENLVLLQESIELRVLVLAPSKMGRHVSRAGSIRVLELGFAHSLLAPLLNLANGVSLADLALTPRKVLAMQDRSGIMFSMNRLSTEKRAAILSMLVEGNSLRATTRMAGCSINTVSKLLLDVGEACAAYQDEHLRDLDCKAIEADEIWSFVAHTERNKPQELKGTFGTGDVWTWTALDADTKLIVCWYVGDRQREDAEAFMLDLRERVMGRIQLTTDGHGAYPNAVGLAFRHNIDFAQLIKQYTSPREGQARYSPPVCTGARCV